MKRIYGTSKVFSVFQRATLAEINTLRTTPQHYAETRLKDEYRVGRDNGAFHEIVRRQPIGPLKLDRALCRMAQRYAQHLARTNQWGHFCDGTPLERAYAAGYRAYGGENVAAGTYQNLDAETDPFRAARIFVCRLAINEGVPDVGHRLNMLRPDYRAIGVGYARDPDATYSNYTVHDFGRR